MMSPGPAKAGQGPAKAGHYLLTDPARAVFGSPYRRRVSTKDMKDTNVYLMSRR